MVLLNQILFRSLSECKNGVIKIFGFKPTFLHKNKVWVGRSIQISDSYELTYSR